MNPGLTVTIGGVGAWGPGFSSWQDLKGLLAPGHAAMPSLEPTARPAPSCIPARERRRAPLSVKLAVAVADEACTMAGVTPADATCVFASGMGDMDITDYMCRTLTEDEPLLSPTKFHNSVHNAPVGYWSISQDCKRSSNAVAGFQHTVPASLLEAITQCVCEASPVLWASQDLASPTPFEDIARIPEASAFALLLTPDNSGSGVGLGRLQVSTQPGSGRWPDGPSGALKSLYDANPSARVLPVLQALMTSASMRFCLPLNEALDLEVQRS